jgi:hypothetical protein
MFDIVVLAILIGLVGLVAGELVDGVRGGSRKLHDRYHE